MGGGSQSRGRKKAGVEELRSCERLDEKARRRMEWKNGEVSLWKIHSVVERKGLPSTTAGRQPLDRQSGGWGETPIMEVCTVGLK